jgi:hypothetical protein
MSNWRIGRRPESSSGRAGLFCRSEAHPELRLFVRRGRAAQLPLVTGWLAMVLSSSGLVPEHNERLSSRFPSVGRDHE